ncbi:membrane protein [Arthrobacter phage DevitoJr]|uniref:Membrane protein n=1 Tax=Arthrobacter phage DevitoJr TaxID=2859477 RepID=A0AAE7SNG1_9CAUD|nr:membrane protein [Arthrobacter phage DevitoJr]QXO13202.1 membrane protein [Arthrobacter phage DevitoJr]
MSEINTKTNTCEKCGLTSKDHRIFKLEATEVNNTTFLKVVCYSEGACEYRQKEHPELMAHLDLESTTPCQICGFRSEDSQDFVSGYANSFICKDSDACWRRKRRDDIVASIKEMAKKPHVHPVDKVTRTTVLLCGIFMGVVSGMGLSYLLFGV